MTETVRSVPPMMAPGGLNGEVGPKSTTKTYVFPGALPLDCPALTQKSELFFAFGMLGVEEAALDVRLTSTEHDVEAEPQVLAAVHSCAGLAAEQAYLLLFD